MGEHGICIAQSGEISVLTSILVLHWSHTSLASFVPLLCLHELFSPSFHISTHPCLLFPSLPAPFCALLATLSPPAEGGLLPVPFPSEELESPLFSLFSVFSLGMFSFSEGCMLT